MLGKKSLAIALMGLGLVGSACADTLTVKFQATVAAKSCDFSVNGFSGQNATVVNFENAKKASTTEAKPLIFKLECGDAATFTTATVTGDAAATLNTKQATDGSAQFAFYDDNGSKTAASETPWNSANGITFDDEGEQYKWVKFVTTRFAPLGDHDADVIYTVQYQ